MKISVSRYCLQPKSSLNAVAVRAPRQGALLRLEDAQGHVGYSDLHPWVELGDLSLEEQLRAIQDRRPTSLGQQSLRLAQQDLEMRQHKRNYFDEGVALKNNFVISDSNEFVSDDFLTDLKVQGFKTLKIKCGRDEKLEVLFLERLSKFGFHLRLDFNAAVDFETYQTFMSHLSEQTRKHIEYVEDPCPFDINLWERARVWAPLALDNEWDKVHGQDVSFLPVDVLILKPAKMNVAQALERALKYNLKVTVTNYMDHLVGTMHALGVAMKLKQQYGDLILDCGCWTHSLYEPNDFSQALVTEGPVILGPQDMGVGFSSLLESLEWQTLTLN